ncbi:MAG: methionine--tRNA ligase subunit beta, partial [Lachnospiraceae bacterium]|nr:methionine--tRNA ligase subunit beta [Lachnospiraceae bacterium]
DECKKFGSYVSGTKVTKTPEILFARVEKQVVPAKASRLTQAQNAAAAAEAAGGKAKDNGAGGVANSEDCGTGQSAAEATDTQSVIDIEPKPEITYDDFAKLQFQVGEIIACEEVKKSKKLLSSQVKIGSQVKQIVSGIKAHYSAQEMVGKKVMVLVNLKPATLAGIVSEGMLLCAEDENGELALMVPEKKMPSGAEIC